MEPAVKLTPRQARQAKPPAHAACAFWAAGAQETLSTHVDAGLFLLYLQI